jgi:hypothetical protein
MALALALVLAAPALGLRPSDVLADIQRRGPDVVRAELYNDEARWRQVMRGVESGATPWLAVAQRLKDIRSDASEDLTIAVSRALRRAPASVLTILDAGFDADDVCSLNTLEMTLGDTYALALREVEARERAVAAVREPRLAARRGECLSFLAELKEALDTNREEWFGR